MVIVVALLEVLVTSVVVFAGVTGSHNLNIVETLANLAKLGRLRKFIFRLQAFWAQLSPLISCLSTLAIYMNSTNTCNLSWLHFPQVFDFHSELESGHPSKKLAYLLVALFQPISASRGKLWGLDFETKFKNLLDMKRQKLSCWNLIRLNLLT